MPTASTTATETFTLLEADAATPAHVGSNQAQTKIANARTLILKTCFFVTHLPIVYQSVNGQTASLRRLRSAFPVRAQKKAQPPGPVGADELLSNTSTLQTHEQQN